MSAATGEANAPFAWRRGLVAALIALVYAVAGPSIGATVVLLFAVITGQFTSESISKDLPTLIFVGFTLSYMLAGTLALVTGVATAFIAYRRGIVRAVHAIIVPTVVVVVFAVLQRLFHGNLPGAVILRGGEQVLPAIVLVVSIVASLICWQLTRPLQRRLA